MDNLTSILVVVIISFVAFVAFITFAFLVEINDRNREIAKLRKFIKSHHPSLQKSPVSLDDLWRDVKRRLGFTHDGRRWHPESANVLWGAFREAKQTIYFDSTQKEWLHTLVGTLTSVVLEEREKSLSGKVDMEVEFDDQGGFLIKRKE